MLYLVAFVAVQTPGFVYRMYQLYDDNGFTHHSVMEYVLYVLQAVTQPSQGFFTCLLYSYNRFGASGAARHVEQEGSSPRLAPHELAALQTQIKSIEEQMQLLAFARESMPMASKGNPPPTAL